MIHSIMQEGDNKRLQNILLFITFLLHLAWTVYVCSAETIGFIEKVQKIMTSTYAEHGFEWRGMGAYLVTATLLSSFFTNSIRRISEGIAMGWPRFKEHDKHSLIRAVFLLVGYGVLIYFAVGFFGEKYSSRPLDFINVGLIAVSTYIVGMLVDFADDAISGIYIIYHEDN